MEYNIRNAENNFDKKNIIVATTNEKEDDLIHDICISKGINVYRGSTKNKIDRWINAAEAINCDVILPFDGDDPFTDLNIGKSVLKNLIMRAYSESDNLPCGCFTYAINVKSLKRVASKFDTSDSEMMWIFEKDGDTKYGEYDCKLDETTQI